MCIDIKIIVVEDEPKTQRGIISAITNISPHYKIIDSAFNGLEALAKIKCNKPDLVITDIRMPIMDGLELVHKVKQEFPDIMCVILTGYADFSYAKEALTMQVKDYLLKPVDQEELKSLLFHLHLKIINNIKQEQSSYISYIFYRKGEYQFINNPFIGFRTAFLLIHFGPAINVIHNECSKGKEAMALIPDNFTDMEEEYGIFVNSLNNNHYNEIILTISYDINENKDILKISESILELINNNEIFINALLTPQVDNGDNIGETLHDSHVYSLLRLVYGKTTFISQKNNPKDTAIISVSNKCKELAQNLIPDINKNRLEEIVSSLIHHWNNNSYTQLQIQTDMHHMFTKAIKKSHKNNSSFSSPADIIAESNNYKELEDLFLSELENISCRNCLVTKDTSIEHLAISIKEYIDQNLIENITYKTLNEEFGYHEKYVTLIFKDKYGISPSKYIVQERMRIAKELIRRNPKTKLKIISENVGYEDPLYFSRVFKNSEGISPKEFQNKYI